jgi:hypothetical protein
MALDLAESLSYNGETPQSSKTPEAWAKENEQTHESPFLI